METPAALDPLTLLRALAAFGLVISLWTVIVLVWLHRRRRRRVDAQLAERIAAESSFGGDDGTPTRTLRLWHEGEEATIEVEKTRTRPTLAERARIVHRDAGYTTPLRPMLTGLALGVVGVGLALLLLTGRVMPAVVGPTMLLLIVAWRTQVRLNRRTVVFERQLLDALELSARALRAGHPLLASFQLIADEVPAPVGELFSDVCQQQQMGLPIEETLRRAAHLSGSPDMRLFAASLAIHARTGGNLADVMDGIGLVIRERMRLGRRFRVLIAQTNLSKRILIAMPFVMFAVLNAIGPEYMTPLYATRTGNLLLGISLLSVTFGWVLMNRMSVLKA